MSVSVQVSALVSSYDPSDGYCGRRNTGYPAVSSASLLKRDVQLEDFMYLIITREPGGSYHKKFSLCCCVRFRSLYVTIFGWLSVALSPQKQ